MIVKRGKGDYTRIYRPLRVSEIYGQQQAKLLIGRGLDEESLPTVLLFHGISGTGKTTCARIVAMGLTCEKGMTSEPCCKCNSCKGHYGGGGHFALNEYNAAHFTGIDHMRREAGYFDCAPLGYDHKIIVFDECHRLSKEAQTLLLKPVEDGIPDTYFIFCSTDPENIIHTLRNRCVPVEFQKLQDEVIWELLIDVCKWERVKYAPEVLDNIVRKSEGMARNALHLLQKAVISLTNRTVDEQLG